MTRKNQFIEKYGPWAIVTGASAGIGEEFAHQLAERGLNLVLVARRQQKLEILAQALERTHGVDVRVVAADLSHPDFLKQVDSMTNDIEVGLLVNNAGLYEVGSFLDTSMETQLKILEVNTRSPLVLSHHFGQKMRHQGHGGIIMVSSTVGGTGAPFNANYAATKAFDLIFGEGLHAELRTQGVDVQVLMPGGTRTEGATRMMKDAPSYMQMMMMETEPVVRLSLNKLGKKTRVIPGMMNQSMVFMVARLLPRLLGVAMWSSMMKGMMPTNTATQPSKTYAS